jgi:hypothetical protein
MMAMMKKASAQLSMSGLLKMFGVKPKTSASKTHASGQEPIGVPRQCRASATCVVGMRHAASAV